MPRKTVTMHRQTPDGRLLASRRMVAVITARDTETIRKHCTPVACDITNRTPLYDAEEARALLATRPRVSRGQRVTA